ncbi:hypothetical protein [Photorhabdus sp. CRCIA-P01]|uniref:hypothetical protein n=1 Tax=Photorhabdus sp. CRCIA-P01 TaxID=2019570 RepID=UPI001E4978ED|nr:hypothetical protein [Photorhabdus sp. CRCIA-P01]
MDKRSTPLVRATSYLLIYLTAVYPLYPAIAAGITPDDNSQTQVQNQGNVPVNTTAQGNPVPVLYGTREIGGAIISAGIYTEAQQ